MFPLGMLRPGGDDLTIAGGVREFARATPHATAIIDGDRRLSYAALNERASRLANALLAAGLHGPARETNGRSPRGSAANGATGAASHGRTSGWPAGMHPDSGHDHLPRGSSADRAAGGPGENGDTSGGQPGDTSGGSGTVGSAPWLGDRVAVLLGNRLEYPEIAAGIAKAGLVMVPLNPRLTGPEVEFIVGHSGARALIVDSAYAASAAGLTGLDLVLCLDGVALGASYEMALETASATDPRIPVDERDPFCVTYTSGTTGDPKGVLISHRSRVLTFYATALEWGLGPGRRGIAVAPMYHGAGFAFAYASVFCGGTVSMLRTFDAGRVLEMIARDRAQSVFLVPTHAQLIRAAHPAPASTYDLSSLDTLYFNAAALPKPLKEWVLDAFPGVGVHELYGSTEAGVVTNLRPVDARRKAGSVGHPWFATQVRVLRDDGSFAAAGEPGELFSRSPFLMNGYLHNDAATAACVTPDGFLTSGDIVIVDDEGFISIVDRKKDVIISGGVNVYPRDVEEALATHPLVVEAAVIGEPDPQWGERVVAHVVSTAALSPEALDAYLRTRLAGYKLPKSYHFVPTLPRNAAGKIQRRDLRT